MDYDMKLYGFWPTDLAVVTILFVFVHALGNSLLLDLGIVGSALWVAWRARKRPSRYVTSLLAFATTPSRHGVAICREINPRRRS